MFINVKLSDYRTLFINVIIFTFTLIIADLYVNKLNRIYLDILSDIYSEISDNILNVNVRYLKVLA